MIEGVDLGYPREACYFPVWACLRLGICTMSGAHGVLTNPHEALKGMDPC